MRRLSLPACLSALLASASLTLPHPALARPGARFAALEDTVPKVRPFGPAEVLTDTSVLGRWEIDTDDFGDRADTNFRGRMVTHFYADHTMETHYWSLSLDSDRVPDYSGSHLAGTWFVRDTLLGVIMTDCQGFTPRDERECAASKSEEHFGKDTGISVIAPRAGDRFMRDTSMFAMLVFKYGGPERDVDPPSFWVEGVPVRPRAYVPDNSVPVPAGPLYDLLGRRPRTIPAATPRFRMPRPGRIAGS